MKYTVLFIPTAALWAKKFQTKEDAEEFLEHLVERHSNVTPALREKLEVVEVDDV